MFCCSFVPQIVTLAWYGSFMQITNERSHGHGSQLAYVRSTSVALMIIKFCVKLNWKKYTNEKLSHSFRILMFGATQ